jgi:hypothetical protein
MKDCCSPSHHDVVSKFVKAIAPTDFGAIRADCPEMARGALKSARADYMDYINDGSSCRITPYAS